MFCLVAEGSHLSTIQILFQPFSIFPQTVFLQLLMFCLSSTLFMAAMKPGGGIGGIIHPTDGSCLPIDLILDHLASCYCHRLEFVSLL